jgi:hypothetical protein
LDPGRVDSIQRLRRQPERQNRSNEPKRAVLRVLPADAPEQPSTNLKVAAERPARGAVKRDVGATARTACTNARHYFASGEVEKRRWYFGSNCSSMKASLIVMGVKVGPATVRRCRAPQRRERPTVDFTLPSTQPESRTATSVRASACEATAVAVQDAQLLGSRHTRKHTANCQRRQAHCQRARQARLARARRSS